MSRGMRPAAAWSTDAGRSLDVPTEPPAAGPSSPPVVERERQRKFTALLDAEADARFGRLLEELRARVGPIATRSDGSGRVRSGYDVSRADLLRALLAVAEDPDRSGVWEPLTQQVRHHYGVTAERHDIATS
jgi:hypothetical protein